MGGWPPGFRPFFVWDVSNVASVTNCGTGPPSAERTNNALVLANRVDAVDGRQLDRFHRARRPVDFGGARIGSVPQSKVRTLIVRRDVAAAAHHVFSLPHPVG